MIARRFLLAVCLACLLGVSSAEAQWGYRGLAMNYYGYGYPYGSFIGSNYTPPYFALHPPVYYSGAIERIPYGSSPFAAPYLGAYVGRIRASASAPTVSTEPAKGEMIVNPYVRSGKKTTAAPLAPPMLPPMVPGVPNQNGETAPFAREEGLRNPFFAPENG